MEHSTSKNKRTKSWFRGIVTRQFRIISNEYIKFWIYWQKAFAIGLFFCKKLCDFLQKNMWYLFEYAGIPMADANPSI